MEVRIAFTNPRRRAARVRATQRSLALHTARSVLGLCLVTVVVAVRPLVGQLALGEPPTAAECTDAARALRGGSRDSSDWEILSSCGRVGGNALAATLRRLRAESDPDYLAGLYTAAGTIQDSAVFSASNGLARNARAHAASRVTALLIALSQIEPAIMPSMRLSWASVLTTPRGDECRWTVGGEWPRYASMTSLPATALQRLVATTDIIRARDSDPIVRDMSRCVRRALTRQAPPRVPFSALRLTYLCGNRFRVHNNGLEWALVKFRVAQTSDSGDLSVGPRDSVAFTTQQTGTTLLFYYGRQVQRVANRGIGCP
jgi:hypothetical protein